MLFEPSLEGLKILFPHIIAQADADPNKWYELFFEDESGSTQTIQPAETFDPMKPLYARAVAEYRKGNCRVDLWEERDGCPQNVFCFHSPQALEVIPAYRNVYFRINSGYEWGKGMPEEKSTAFFKEMKAIFSAKGFQIQPDEYGSCPTFINGKTRLYCHPQELSGRCDEDLIPQIEALLSSGKTFTHTGTDRFELIYDLTPEQEVEYYKLKYAGRIEKMLTSLFYTGDKRRYKSRCSLIDDLAGQLQISTVKHGTELSFNPVLQYVHFAYRLLVLHGILIERKGKDGELCRSALRDEIPGLS